MMNPDIKKKWIAALESGEYSQTTQRLKDANGFCCLGVLTDLFIKETDEGEWQEQHGVQVFVSLPDALERVEKESSFLPQRVKQWAGLYRPGAMLTDTTEIVIRELMIANDGCAKKDNDPDDFEPVPSKSFCEIAQMIRESL